MRRRRLEARHDGEARAQGQLLFGARCHEGPQGNRGFELDAPDSRKGLGLPGMQERAARLGARCEIESGSERGTRVRIEVPIDRTSEDPSTRREEA